MFQLRMAYCLKYSSKHKHMPDNKNQQGTQDDIRVDANDSAEMEYLKQQFPEKTQEEIKQAIFDAGPFRADIIAYLGRR